MNKVSSCSRRWTEQIRQQRRPNPDQLKRCGPALQKCLSDILNQKHTYLQQPKFSSRNSSHKVGREQWKQKQNLRLRIHTRLQIVKSPISEKHWSTSSPLIQPTPAARRTHRNSFIVVVTARVFGITADLILLLLNNSVMRLWRVGGANTKPQGHMWRQTTASTFNHLSGTFTFCSFCPEQREHTPSVSMNWSPVHHV